LPLPRSDLRVFVAYRKRLSHGLGTGFGIIAGDGAGIDCQDHQVTLAAVGLVTMQRASIGEYLLAITSLPAFACICVEPVSPSEWYKIHHGQPTFSFTSDTSASVYKSSPLGRKTPYSQK
jgi:hypothetical protein